MNPGLWTVKDLDLYLIAVEIFYLFKKPLSRPGEDQGHRGGHGRPKMLSLGKKRSKRLRGRVARLEGDSSSL